MPFDLGLATQLEVSPGQEGGLAPALFSFVNYADCRPRHLVKPMLVRGLWFFGLAFSLLLNWRWKFVGGLKN
jgi:hypothetical protein